MTRRLPAKTAVLVSALVSASTGLANQPSLPHPEGPLQALRCEWNSARELDYTETRRPKVETVPLTNQTYYPPFTMTTNGRDLFAITLPRWDVSRDWRFVIEDYTCVPNRISITCNTGSFTITLDRGTLRGVELNTFQMGFVEEPPTVTVSHFSCAIAH